MPFLHLHTLDICRVESCETFVDLEVLQLRVPRHMTMVESLGVHVKGWPSSSEGKKQHK